MTTASAPPALDVARIRADFPILTRRVHGEPLTYLDNAATSQRPQAVIGAEAEFSRTDNANIHRGVHTLSQRATEHYDGARELVRRFLNAPTAEEVVFTSGTTAGLNLIAQSYGGSVLAAGDEILLSEMEHHSNIVPWQLVAAGVGARIRAIPVNDAGEIDPGELERWLTARTRIVSLTHVSNVLGTVNPIRAVADRVHAAGAVLVVDGAQAVPHLKVDVQALGCDFYVASGHKMYGPTGVGFLFGRAHLLERMPPWQGGGGMIQSVTIETASFAPPPRRFEAGTPPIAQVVGLGAAVDYLGKLDWAAVEAHESHLLAYAAARLAEVPGLSLLGGPRERVGCLSFLIERIHPHDVGTVLDLHGVAVRAGHHCAEPLMRRFSIPGTVRASFGIYNTTAEVDRLVRGLEETRRVFSA